MKSFSRFIDRFCYKHPGFGIPRLMLAIVIISAVVFLLLNTEAAFGYLVFHPGLIMRGQVWRLVTWIFLPVNSSGGMNSLFFTAIALYFYYFIGSTLEREWGTGKFTMYYIFGVLLHVVYGFLIYYLFKTLIYIYPMYLNLSMFFAFAVLFPDHTVRLFFILPIKIKWLAMLNAVFFAFSLITGLVAGYFVTAFLPLVALLNFFLVCGDELMANLHPLMNRVSPRVINFKKEAKRVKRNMDSNPYRHKCAVCGKTDIDCPDMEFRYCSLCSGYHCFCKEHINNHIHFSG